MDTPQEVEVWFVLPALRRQFVIALKKQGMKQKEIASLMNLTEPAVSQYLKNKRGDSIEFTQEIEKNIEESCKRIDNEKKFKKEFQNLLKKVRVSKFICRVCHDHIKTEDNCKICY